MLFFFIPMALFAKECEIGYRVLYAIAQVERHPKKEVGYPYLISFNKTSQTAILAKLKATMPQLRYKFLDKRTIDCLNIQNCILIFKELQKHSINNIDLGAFQINPIYHKYPAENYFTLKSSLLIACKIVTDLKNKYGWSWESLARYHSYERNNNYKYQGYLKQYAQANGEF